MKKLITSIVLGLLCSYTSLAQLESTTKSDSKFSIEAQIQFNDPTIDVHLTNSSLTGLNFDDYYPTHKSGLSFGLRGQYNVWKSFSAYGKFGHNSNDAEIPVDLQSAINPFLGLLGSVAGNLPIDLSTLSIKTNINDGYSMQSYITGISYSYTKSKINISPYIGLGISNLHTPSSTVDMSFDIDFLGSAVTIPLPGLLEIERESGTDFTWESGINITYDITDKFYAGFNLEYSKTSFDLDPTTIKFNENAFPEIINIFLPDGANLSLIPDFTADTKIDYSTLKYGLTVGFRL